MTLKVLTSYLYLPQQPTQTINLNFQFITAQSKLECVLKKIRHKERGQTINSEHRITGTFALTVGIMKL